MSDHLQNWVVTAQFSIYAMSPQEALDIIYRALKDRIDGWTLEAQRQAHLIGVRNG